jgi:glycosyltransferase involved in cell wall biosynthesis
MINHSYYFVINSFYGGVTQFYKNHARTLQEAGKSVRFLMTDSTAMGNQSNVDFEFPWSNFDELTLEMLLNEEFNQNSKPVFFTSEGSEIEGLRKYYKKVNLCFVYHGDYDLYYNMGYKYQSVIDNHIVVSNQIYNRINTQYFLFKPNVIFQPAKIEKSSIDLTIKTENSIAFIGRPTNEKGFDDLVKLIRKTEEHKIIFQWHLFGIEKKDAPMLTSYSNVVLYGMIKNDNIPKYIANIKYFFLPSKSEGLPISLLEAINCGLIPILNRYNNSVDLFVKNGRDGIIYNNLEDNQLADLISGLYNENNLQRDAHRDREILTPFINSNMLKATFKKRRFKFFPPFLMREVLFQFLKFSTKFS